MYKVVDLFSGAGGLSLGFTQTGRFSVVAAAENNPNARKTYLRLSNYLRVNFALLGDSTRENFFFASRTSVSIAAKI